ncbi:MAG: hypothetical protein NC218_01285, partial [Acetobacter sp.]|nr:hypothetical protein [Acetobacter sp.]
MARLYDEADANTPKKKPPRKPRLPKEKGLGGGLSNQAPLNDYRNRMPFRVVKEDGQEYYYWQYGAIFELELEITDVEIPLVPDAVVDVVTQKGTIVDPHSKIASISLGSMSQEDKDDYMSASAIEKLLQRAVTVINNAKRLISDANKQMDALEKVLAGGGTVDDVVIQNIQTQITELRATVAKFERYADEMDDIRKNLEAAKTEASQLVNDLRKEQQARLAEIVSSYQSRLSELEERCVKRSQEQATIHSTDIQNVQTQITKIREDGVGAQVSFELPTGAQSPLFVIMDKKLYVKVDGKYVEAGSASVVPIIPEKVVTVTVDNDIMAITNVDAVTV